MIDHRRRRLRTITRIKHRNTSYFRTWLRLELKFAFAVTFPSHIDSSEIKTFRYLVVSSRPLSTTASETTTLEWLAFGISVSLVDLEVYTNHKVDGCTRVRACISWSRIAHIEQWVRNRKWRKKWDRDQRASHYALLYIAHVYLILADAKSKEFR